MITNQHMVTVIGVVEALNPSNDHSSFWYAVTANDVTFKLMGTYPSLREGDLITAMGKIVDYASDGIAIEVEFLKIMQPAEDLKDVQP